MGTDTRATEEYVNKLSLLEEQLNVVGEDCNKIAKEKNYSTLDFQHLGTDSDDIDEVLEDDTLLEDQLKYVREDW
jgi:hypothetical protein